MYDILENYVLSHPGAQPRDIIKFCYQSLLGPGHMAPERGRAAAFAAEELEKAGRRRAGEPEVELLEGGAARLDVDCRLSTRSLAALCSDPRISRPCCPLTGEYLHRLWMNGGMPDARPSAIVSSINRVTAPITV